MRAITDRADVALLADPVPPGATLPGQWWPPRLLEPDFLLGEVGRIDVLHVHFGFDTTPPATLREVAAILATHNVPLVLTVHDLHNPHFVDTADHLSRLDVLVPAADAVVTLTDGAADAIADRWGRRPLVLPHPHVLPIEAIGRPRARRTEPVVGLHAKALRANIDPLPVLEILLEAHPGQPWRLRLDIDDEVTSSPRADVLPAALLADLTRRGVDVRVHPRFSDAELTHYLGEVDVLVLPYRFGTHSGWVEACSDAGVCAVVPDCGFFHEQHGDPAYRCVGGVPDPVSLRAAVAEAVDVVGLRSTGDDVSRRRLRMDQRDMIRRETTNLYRRVLAEAAAA